MFTDIPEQLSKIADDIGEQGSAELRRLTVLKKWFQHPGRLVPFAVWVASRATSRKGKTKGEAALLFREARALLKGLDKLRPEFDRPAARRLFDRLQAFQKDYERQRWALVRVVKNRNLLIIEQSLAIMLADSPKPNDGYRLGADYCRHDDPRTARGLSAKSTTKILEIMRFMFTQEALEDGPSTPRPPSLPIAGCMADNHPHEPTVSVQLSQSADLHRATLCGARIWPVGRQPWEFEH